MAVKPLIFFGGAKEDRTPDLYIAKVGVEGSNPFARSSETLGFFLKALLQNLPWVVYG